MRATTLFLLGLLLTFLILAISPVDSRRRHKLFKSKHHSASHPKRSRGAARPAARANGGTADSGDQRPAVAVAAAAATAAEKPKHRKLKVKIKGQGHMDYLKSIGGGAVRQDAELKLLHKKLRSHRKYD